MNNDISLKNGDKVSAKYHKRFISIQYLAKNIRRAIYEQALVPQWTSLGPSVNKQWSLVEQAVGNMCPKNVHRLGQYILSSTSNIFIIHSNHQTLRSLLTATQSYHSYSQHLKNTFPVHCYLLLFYHSTSIFMTMRSAISPSILWL